MFQQSEHPATICNHVITGMCTCLKFTDGMGNPWRFLSCWDFSGAQLYQATLAQHRSAEDVHVHRFPRAHGVAVHEDVHLFALLRRPPPKRTLLVASQGTGPLRTTKASLPVEIIGTTSWWDNLIGIGIGVLRDIMVRVGLSVALGTARRIATNRCPLWFRCSARSSQQVQRRPVFLSTQL